MLTIVMVAVVALIVLVLLIAASRPDTSHVARSISINAPPEKIFPFVNSLRSDGFGAWSPFDAMDPAMKKAYSGPPVGRGAIYEWVGNNKVGTGRMEIIESSPFAKVVMKLDFLKPFEGHNVAEFALAPIADATRVTWTMDGPSSFMAKLMGLFLNMDKMIGGQFETGLAKLKTITEK